MYVEKQLENMDRQVLPMLSRPGTESFAVSMAPFSVMLLLASSGGSLALFLELIIFVPYLDNHSIICHPHRVSVFLCGKLPRATNHSKKILPSNTTIGEGNRKPGGTEREKIVN